MLGLLAVDELDKTRIKVRGGTIARCFEMTNVKATDLDLTVNESPGETSTG